MEKINTDSHVQVDSPIHIIQQNFEEFTDSLKIDSNAIKEKKILRFEVEIEPIEPVKWLIHQNFEEKYFWSDREDQFQMAGVGQVDSLYSNGESDLKLLFEKAKNNLDSEFRHLRYYGGVSFSQTSKRSGDWEPFGNFKFQIPEFEVFTCENKTFFAINFAITPGIPVNEKLESVHNDLAKIQFNLDFENPDLPVIINKKDLTSKEEWTESILRSTELIKENVFQKIVLAKRSVFGLEKEIVPTSLLYITNKNKRNSYAFYFQPKANHAFIANSPELLYKRTGRQLHTEAIAGTRRRGTTIEDDKTIENDLMTCAKDLEEHRFVQKFVETGLQKISKTSYEKSELSVLKLPKVQHLFCGFSSILKEEVSDFDILSTFHPTPAVGGFPQRESVSKIESFEKFDRGWYAGPIGWIGSDSAEFVVGIRSGLVNRNHLSLYAGAGIVADSEPEAEWQETENKMLNFLRFFEYK